MSETYTPGPWRTGEGDYSDFIYCEGEDDAIAIAFVNDANARLIAASPDLVEALAYLVSECDPDMDDDYNPHAAPLAKARAALAKVEAGR